ncbi:hypothetical protein RI129_009843 [Pyrocoelia pectoralis]|uniref:Ankyrin repeat domain-containing protein n=1 Tax=Pyrocoelia pectoralis TaxID=417401 RepID=A0AAN7VA34_9COLE
MTIKNNDGYTPLDMAVEREHLNVVKTLLLKGSPVNSVNDEGNGALHHAAWHGQLDMALALLGKGADKTHKNKAGQTPRDMALARGHVDVANVL